MRLCETDLQQIVESTSDLLLVIDESGFVRYAGAAAAAATGHSPVELFGRSIFMLMHPRDADRLVPIFQAALERRAGGSAECRIRRKDGAWRVFDMRVDPLGTDPEPGQLLISARDVTARSHAARQMRLAQSILRSHDEVHQDAVLILSAEGDVLQCNLRFLTLWKIDPAFTLLRCEAEVWPRVLVELEQPQAFLDLVSSAAADPHSSRQVRLKTRNGAVLECCTAPIEPFSEDERARLWRFRDITDQQHRQDQFVINGSLASIGRSALRIAHDFRNTLIPVTGHAALLAASLPKDDPAQENVRAILRAAELGDELSRQLLQCARQEPAARDEVNLGSLVREALPLLRAAAGKAQLRAAIEADAPSMWGNPLDIWRLLFNLVVNAAHAIEGPDGVIEIGVAATDVQRNCDTHAAAQRAVRLTVADNGVGMSAKKLQAARCPDPCAGNSARGLGLAIVQEIVADHRARVSVESRPRSGTAFRIDFPVAPDAARWSSVQP